MENQVLVFKHEVLLTFVGRLIHDHEFCEWFATEPSSALASHGLAPRDVQDLAGVLRTDRRQREFSEALQPMVQVLLDLIDDAQADVGNSRAQDRLERLDLEIQSARERVADARTRRPRPWWKFWS